MAPHSSTLAWKIPWMEEPGRLQSMGSLRADTTERLHFHFSLSCIGEGNGNPLQCSCLENPRDRGAWRAAVYGVAQSRTRLTRLSSSSSSSMLSGWGSANWPIIAEKWWLYTEGEKTKIWLSRIAWGNKTSTSLPLASNKTSTSLPLARCACMHTHTHTRYYYHRDQLPKCCYPLSGWCPLELSQGLLLRHRNGLSWWSDDKAVTLTPLFDRILLLSSQVDLERNRSRH